MAHRNCYFENYSSWKEQALSIGKMQWNKKREIDWEREKKNLVQAEVTEICYLSCCGNGGDRERTRAREEKWEKPLWLIAKMSDASDFPNPSLCLCLFCCGRYCFCFDAIRNYIANLHSHTSACSLPILNARTHSRTASSLLYCCKCSLLILYVQCDQNRYLKKLFRLYLSCWQS